VSALDPDGFSDYWGVSVSLERQSSGRLRYWGGYTHSRTRDNWMGAAGGGATGTGPAGQLTPFPDSLGGSDWAEGTSDFDVPHRAVLGVELAVTPALRLAALYRYRSGRPFTPGFPAGVDANGDGSTVNDPAFVDDALPGIDSLLAAWPCLQAHVGAFVPRNTCREPGVHALDLRLAVHVRRSRDGRGGGLEFTADVLNVMQPDAGTRDAALYRVDGATGLVTDPVTGQVTVPLIVNGNFGSVLYRHAPARQVRLGLRVTL
jgi:hypothetical protein